MGSRPAERDLTTLIEGMSEDQFFVESEVGMGGTRERAAEGDSHSSASIYTKNP